MRYYRFDDAYYLRTLARSPKDRPRRVFLDFFASPRPGLRRSESASSGFDGIRDLCFCKLLSLSVSFGLHPRTPARPRASGLTAFRQLVVYLAYSLAHRPASVMHCTRLRFIVCDFPRLSYVNDCRTVRERIRIEVTVAAFLASRFGRHERDDRSFLSTVGRLSFDERSSRCARDSTTRATLRIDRVFPSGPVDG